MEILPLEVKCPKCGTPMPYLAELASREVFCLGCGSHFVIPDLGGHSDCAQPQHRVVRADAITPELRKSGDISPDEPSV